jgi:hypothetical protein
VVAVSTPRTQHDQLQRIRQQIETDTELRAMETLFSLGQPGSLQHRRFRFELPSSSYGAPGQSPNADLQLDVIDDLVILVAHDVDPHQEDASWRLASDDVAKLLIGLMASDVGQEIRVPGGGSTPSLRGQTIEQRIRLQYRYYLTLPEPT